MKQITQTTTGYFAALLPIYLIQFSLRVEIGLLIALQSDQRRVGSIKVFLLNCNTKQDWNRIVKKYTTTVQYL